MARGIVPCSRRWSKVASIALFVALVLAVSIAAGAQEKRLVVFAGEWNLLNENGQWQALTEHFKAAHPGVEIEIVPFPGGVGDAAQHLVLLQASGVTVDVVAIHSSNFTQLLGGGLIQPITEFYERDTTLDKDDLIPGLHLSYATPTDRYGLMMYLSPRAISYNRTHLNEIGVGDVPETWTYDDMFDISRRARVFAPDGRLLMGGWQHHWESIFWHHNAFSEVLWAYGESYFNADATELTLHTPGARRVVNMIADGYRDGLLVQEGFEEGAATFAIMGTWAYTDYAYLPFEVGVQRYPEGPAGSYNQPGSWAFGLSANAAEKDLAWEFIKFASGEGMQKTFLKSGSSAPVRFSQFQSDEWLGFNRPAWDNIKAWEHSIANATSLYTGAHGNDAIMLVGEIWQNVLLGDMSADVFIETVKPLADAILRR